MKKNKLPQTKVRAMSKLHGFFRSLEKSFFYKQIKHVDIFIVFVLTYLILNPKAYGLCNNFPGITFDSQNILLWNYLPQLGVLPIKDTYYPYGLFYYYAFSNTLLFSIYTLISPAIYTVVYLTFKKLFKGMVLVYSALFLLFFTFTINIVEVHSFNRYGLLTALPYVLTYILFRLKNINTSVLIIGVLNGLLILHSVGLGVYIGLISIVLIIFHLKYCRETKLRDVNLRVAFGVFIRFILGFSLGSLPFFYFISHNRMYASLIYYIVDIFEASNFVKRPLLTFSSVTFFMFLIMSVQILMVTNSIIRKFKDYRGYYYHILIASTVSLLALLQKFVSRQHQPMMAGVFIFSFIIMMYPAILSFTKNKISELLIAVNIISVFLMLSISLAFSLNIKEFYSLFKSGVDLTFHQDVSSRICKLEEFNENNIGLSSSYFDVIDLISDKYQANMMFAYPNDPIFYLLLKQKPPPYLNVYEGSPDYSQIKNIEYIKNNKIRYVIYNTDSDDPDGMPDYVRARQITKYILTSFTPIDRVDNFVILIRKQNNDDYFLHNVDQMENYPNLSSWFLNTNYGSIFYSEGFHKKELLLENASVIFSSPKGGNLSKFLDNNIIISENMYILVNFKGESRKGNMIIETDDLVESKINFKLCKKGHCLINLSSLPIFYSDGRVKDIRFSETVNELLLIHNNKRANESLW